MNDDEFNWLNQFSGGKMPKRAGAPIDDATALREAYRIARAQEEIDERALKDTMLDSAFQALADKKEMIRAAFNFEVEVSGRKVKTLAPQKEAFDTEKTSKVTKAPAADTVRDANAAKALLVAQKDRLAAVTIARSQAAWDDAKKPGKLATVTEPLFTDAEIANQFYAPLEREMVIPDNFVTGKYSPTQQMIDETNDIYLKECQEKGGRRDTGAVAISKAAVDAIASVTKALAGAGGDISAGTPLHASNAADPSADQYETIKIITEGVAALVGVGIDVADVSVDAAVTKTFSASKWQGALNNLAVGVAKTVCGALGQQDPTGTSTVGLYESLCDGISAGLSGGAAIAAVSQWANNGADPAKFPIADFVVPIINMAAGATSSYGDSNSPDTPTSVAFNAVTGIIPAVTAVVARAATPEIAKHVKNGDYGAAVLSILPTLGAQLSNALINAMANLNEDNISSDLGDLAAQQGLVNDTAVNSAEEGDFGQEINPLEQGLTESDSASQIVAAWETANAALLAAVEQRLGVRFDEKLAQAGSVDTKTIEEELDAEKQAYQQALDRLSKDQPSDSDFKTINGLIEDIKRKRAIINLALSVASGGFGVGGASVAVAAIARGLKATADVAKAVKSVIAAVDCVIALNKWLDSYGDAINSASPYASAIENFINSNRDLLCHNTVQALASLAQGIAGYASIAIPPVAAAALAMDATASAANFVFQVYRQAALANAWKQTIKSLQSPQDRQLALVVRELNPTLAKYTIAYGAFIARDPIAVRAVGRIGLDRETLSNPNSKLADVKNWLEEVYKDDLTLVADTEMDSSPVRVPTPALTVKAWSVSYMQWSKERDGYTPIATPNPPAILANLERVETYRAITDQVKRQAVEPRLLKALDELASAFASFAALDRGGEPMPDVDNVAKAYARLARAALESEQINAAAAASAAKNAAVGKAAA